VLDLDFLIVTAGDLPEAYFLAACLALRTQRFAIVNVLRPAASHLRALARLRRTRGVFYVTDLLLARLVDAPLVALYRRFAPPGVGAFPEVDAALVQRMRTEHPHLDCADPHAPEVLEFVRAFGPDYILLAGCPILKGTFYARIVRCGRSPSIAPRARATPSIWSASGWTRATWCFADAFPLPSRRCSAI